MRWISGDAAENQRKWWADLAAAASANWDESAMAPTLLVSKLVYRRCGGDEYHRFTAGYMPPSRTGFRGAVEQDR